MDDEDIELELEDELIIDELLVELVELEELVELSELLDTELDRLEELDWVLALSLEEDSDDEVSAGTLPLKVIGCPPQADSVRSNAPAIKEAKGSLLIPIICLARKIED